MKFISHRGNINGSDPKTENKPDQVLKCIEKGLDVEIDIWFLNNKVFLGHDEPEHQISMTFLQKNKRNLWCHAKNFDALILMRQNGIHHFWHQEDFYTITSQGFIWTYPNIKSYSINSVLVITRPEDLKKEMSGCFGICTDYIVDAQKFFTNK
jgi:hypothetical protein